MANHNCNWITFISIIIGPLSALAGVFLKGYLDKKVFFWQDIKDAYKLSEELINSGTCTQYFCTIYKTKKQLPTHEDKTNDIRTALDLIIFLRLEELQNEFSLVREKTNARTQYYSAVLWGDKEYDSELDQELQNAVIDAVIEFQIQLKEKYLRGFLFMIKSKLILVIKRSKFSKCAWPYQKVLANNFRFFQK